MTPKIIFRLEAEIELTSAYLWHEDQSVGLGNDFLRTVDACLAYIQRHPNLFPKVHKHVRRALLRRFPYGIFYLAHKSRIIILAVFHFKRDAKSLKLTLH